MIQCSNLEVRFPDKVLFSQLNWRILPGQRIGLVGDNGVGKTTLMKILAGELEAGEGSIHKAPRISIGYLSQTFSFSSDKPLTELVLEAAGDIRAMEEEIKRTQQALGEEGLSTEDQQGLLTHLGHLQDRFEHLDGYRLEAEAKQILQGLGFRPQDLEEPLSSFSGGWQMRAAMARLLLSSPDLLLLDEPTNHLDVDALEWLERYLKGYEGTVIVISHDRFFLDRVVGRIAEIALGRLKEYPGSYSEYQRRKAEDRERAKAEYLQIKERMQELERFIERFRYKASKASQVQSRVKMLEKMQLPEIEQEAKGLQFHFPPCERSGDIVLEARDVAMDYGRGPVFSGLDLTIKRGERVALVGPNGAGKSTLVRLISGLLEPTSGLLKLGHKVELDVYTQEVEDRMEGLNSVLDELSTHNKGLGQTELRGLLGCFLFSGDSVFKKVEVLSGGEKSRLAVAGLLLEKSNFLVLDEPTNHLDLKAKDMLQRALANFGGTVLVVSHDRYFLDGVVDRVLELREGGLIDRPGNYSEFLAWREELEQKTRQETDAQKAVASSQAAGEKPRSREDRKRATEEKIRRGRILREIEARAGKLEEKIAQHEARMNVLEEVLVREEVYSNAEKMKRYSTEYAKLRDALPELYESWEQALEEHERTKLELEAAS